VIRRRGLATEYRRLRIVGAGALMAAALSGCSNFGYLARAGYEEGRLLWNRKPISAELANHDLPPDVREKLTTVLKVRRFARDRLGLNVGGAYRTITEVDRGAIVYVVMAAPKVSLKPYQWWFPIVGDVPYRGYFDPNDAKAKAAAMEAQGYDTMVRPAVAFSSLGFFNDPLLSNLLKLDRVELAGVIIHELFHRTYFLAGDATFDESAATYVGSRGAVDFFASTEGAASRDAEAARGVYESNLKFAGFLLQAKAKLLRLYTSGLPRDEILKRRGAVFDRIKRDYARVEPSLSGLERFDLDKEPLNNAVMINYLLYFHDLDNFAKLERMNRGDTRATVARIIELAKQNPYDPFYAIWEATHPRAAAEAYPPRRNESAGGIGR
jgi:predicted aminopeptidase